MFFVAIAEKNQTFHFREKCAFTLNALFSRKYRFPFRSETEKRTSGASGTACGGRTPQSGRAERSQGRQSRCRERAERAKGGGRRAERDDRAKGERAERASINRPSQAASNSAEEKCSLFVVSSPFWGAACTPLAKRRKRDGTERRPHRFFAVICSRIRELDCRNVRSLAFLLP